MDAYLKKNGKIIRIGEGRVYSKGDLVLREMNGEEGYTVDANTNNTQMKSGGEALTALKAAAQKNPNGTSAVDGSDIGAEKTSTTNAGDNTTIKVGPTTKPSDLDAIGKTMPAAKILYNNKQQTPVNSSVAPRRTMDEMRENSIPFTKNELTKFLNSI